MIRGPCCRHRVLSVEPSICRGRGNRRQEDSRGDRLGKLLTETAFEIQLENVVGYCTSIQKYSCTLFSSSAVLNNNAASLYMCTNHGGNVVFVSMQAPEV